MHRRQKPYEIQFAGSHHFVLRGDESKSLLGVGAHGRRKTLHDCIASLLVDSYAAQVMHSALAN
ncbi:unannotated protein [freshwater metagenome]|uniref:Unannotated protein n=1 Tax=freshwater metagenome TaxID=449393 RepID=A0A6J6HJ87_9ZZZZ